ncbi:amidase [Sagittula stellata]|uniref:Putative glutamyl-tRNA(Gln) amidotransferase subunit n=1 Tax=Sagittula stellata (strain ATCC 700073 / DSM 11524 / E-37) TaxID=388399 RepID=A3K6R1_SAGS3|nr:amidase [Sagittula stellata]EBA07038.1 putative glutamyl-tRNA(Gln) amidotransferase subunit [Sagittula stellata E-37]
MNAMDLSASDFAARVRAGELSPAQVAQAARARVAERDPALNAMTVLNPALDDEAAEVAARLAAGEDLPLAGVPVVIKDNIWVRGLPVTQGSRLFADFVAPEDARAVSRLRAAGAMILGIAACSEFACKGVTNTPLHGKTRNPVDTKLTTGGSSGGPVAAVAAGMAPLALGTDAGGSSRRPPAHTGLYGFKPTQDLVPYGPGFDEPVDGISAICPMARTLDDIELAMSVLADLRPGIPMPGPYVWSADFGHGQPLDADVATSFETFVRGMVASGGEMTEAAPDWGGLTGGSVMALQHAGLARLFGPAWKKDPSVFDSDIAGQIETGMALRAATLAEAQRASARIGAILNGFLDRYGIVMVPTTPCPAWPVDQLAPTEIGGQPCAPRDHAAFTPQANHAGCPALTVPFARTRAGLPIGLQIMAPRGRDADLLATARTITAALARNTHERAT